MNAEQTFVCGAGCGTPVSGIYCTAHKDRLAPPAPTRGLFAGEKCRFVWRGVEREGVIEKVMRENVKVLIEIKGKQKFLSVRADELLKEAA